MMTRCLWVVLVVAACGKSAPAEKGAAKDCFAYTMPPGWATQPSKTGADLVLAGPGQTPVGDKLVGDTIIIRFLPRPGSFAEFKTLIVAGLKKANADAVVAAQQRAHPEGPKITVDVPPVTVTDVTVGGREAFRVEVTNGMTVDGASVTNIGSTYFIQFGAEVVSIATGYLAPREADLKPLMAAFVASVNFDRCK